VKKVYCLFDRCLGCRSCEIACAVAHSAGRGLEEAMGEKERPRSRLRIRNAGGRPLPVQCRHCDTPACAEACISGAIRKDAETGRVASDPERCVRCWMCVMACPYGAILFRPETAAERCDLCREEDEPACVRACPTKALLFCERAEFESLLGKERRRMKPAIP